MIPQRKVTAGAIAAAVLYTIIRVVELITGKPVPMTADDAVVFQGVIVFLLQYVIRNPEAATAGTPQPPP
jgi:hypothetical protein